jgi:hypothetical protein
MRSYFCSNSLAKKGIQILYLGLIFAGLLIGSQTIYAQQNQTLVENCIDDISGPNNCTANDTNLGLLIIADPDNVECKPVAGSPGEYEAVVFMQAQLNSTAAQRYDLGIFIAEDGGDARTGNCHRNYLPAEPSPLADLGLYDPGTGVFGDGIGPFLDREIGEDDPDVDVCGDLEQDVDTFYDLLQLGHCETNTDVACAFDRECPDFDTGELCDTDGTPDELSGNLDPALGPVPYAYDTVAIRCVDEIGDPLGPTPDQPDGYVDVATCVSWDNTKNNLCKSVFDTAPNTVAKCNCSRSNTNLPMPAFLTLQKTVINDNGGTAVESDFQANISGEGINEDVDWGFKKVLQPGSYTASEMELLGYTASDWGGDCAADGTITLSPGQDAVCSITKFVALPMTMMLHH